MEASERSLKSPFGAPPEKRSCPFARPFFGWEGFPVLKQTTEKYREPVFSNLSTGGKAVWYFSRFRSSGSDKQVTFWGLGRVSGM